MTDLNTFDRVGAVTRDSIVEALGSDWSWQGKRVLDFGCGVGRLLRNLTAEAEVARIDGCDLHQESINWCRANLDPPFSFFVNSSAPPLEGTEDETYDLVIAVSVFTHIANGWAEWLSELQRIIKPGGLLAATFHGPGMATSHQAQSGFPYLEQETGMISLPTGEEGTFASIFHSPWWLQAHWGRAFEPVSILPAGFTGEAGSGHGLFVGKRRTERVTPEDLERAEADEPRELIALQRANAITFGVAQELRERAQRAELSMARRFALTDQGARRMLFRSMIGGERLRQVGSILRRKGGERKR
jgi:ubiquinone/menaquinone biosynthesis C-methylase UbiE